MLIDFLKKRYILILIFILHLILAGSFFPFSELINDEHLTSGDHSFRIYNIQTTKELLKENKLQAFDPFLILSDAGILGKFTKFSIFLSYLFFFIPEVYFYKFYILLLYLLAPVFIYLATSNFGLKKTEKLIAVFLTVITLRFNFTINFYNYVGINDYNFIAYLSIFIFSLLLSTWDSGIYPPEVWRVKSRDHPPSKGLWQR